VGGVFVAMLGPALWGSPHPDPDLPGAWWAWSPARPRPTGTGGREIGTAGRSRSCRPGCALWYHSGHCCRSHEPEDLHTSPHRGVQAWTWPMGPAPDALYYTNAGRPAQSQLRRGHHADRTPVRWWPARRRWAGRSAGGHRVRLGYAAIRSATSPATCPGSWTSTADVLFTPPDGASWYSAHAVPREILGRARGASSGSTGLLIVRSTWGWRWRTFAWLWPVMVGDSITPAHWDAEMWLPSWR